MEKVKFTDIFEDVTKQGRKISTDGYKREGKYPIIDQGQNEIAGYTNEEYGLFNNIPAIIFGDHTRIIKFVNKPFFLGADGVKVLKHIIPNVDYKYSYYALLNVKIPDTGYNRHFKWLKESEIPLPSLEEQKAIAERLDKVSGLIEKRKTQLEKLDLLVKSRFIEMFGEPESNPLHWTMLPLENCLTVLGGYAFKSEEFKTSGIPVLRIGNINTGVFTPTNMVYWAKDSSLERYQVLPGDLVISLTGTVGKDDYGNVCILGNAYPLYYLNQRNAKLVLGESLNKHYLSELLKFSQIKKKLTGISRGVRQANISNRDILNLVVPIPPIELQTQFSAFVEQIDKSKFEIQKSLEKLEILKKSLMQQYFG